jgi:hypothetical protein
MRVRSKLSLIMIVACLLSLFPLSQQASACSRGFAPSLEEEYEGADSIFTGKVTSVEDTYPAGYQKMVHIQPDGESFKGEVQQLIFTRADSDQCGANFQVGESYLFYVHDFTNLYVSVFDNKAVKDASAVIEWLKERANKPPISYTPGFHKVQVNDRGGIGVSFGKHNLGNQHEAVIVDQSVYVPLRIFTDQLGYEGSWSRETKEISLRSDLHAAKVISAAASGAELHNSYATNEATVYYDSIGLTIDGKKQAGFPSTFLYDDELYVPVRAVAERLGMKVGWGDSKSWVYLIPPIEAGKTMALKMKYSVNVGMEGSLEVDQLQGDTITYRAYNGHQPKGYLPEPTTVSFSEMIAEEIGFLKYVPEFYLSDDLQEVKLILEPALVKRLGTDADFRKLVGNKLGSKTSEIPVDRVLRVAFFE